ncbi:glycosyltransferase [Moellerella wisconsensis]|uniref:glycosyltransferase n=1 Tax=Moellerella wisconsensis TaxID=158849 RepID=UPI0025B1178D|nr:glycosyltransferase [Moellerella wisconsensis]WJW81227.1 glycosyltransferase [Moellerella wisconsensis]
MKYKLLFVVSNLRRTGPVNQLLYILSNLDEEKYNVKVLTLSDEPSDTRIFDYKENNIEVISLSLSRIKGIFSAKQKLMSYIQSYNPDIIQSQGIRADSLISKLPNNTPWISTARNYPYEDYPSKFGFIKGYLMAIKHINILTKCHHLVSCSQSIANKLSNIGINSQVIRNGVNVKSIKKNIPIKSSTIKLISVGSLIPRKNMKYLINLSNELNNLGIDFELIILGEGPLLKELQEISCNKVKFLGMVNNVNDYLIASDIFISSSLSEGLPNTVLEALACGLPVVLSDISSHRELTSQLPSKYSLLFSLDTNEFDFAREFNKNIPSLLHIENESISKDTALNFGANTMALNYQKLYERILECQKTSIQ